MDGAAYGADPMVARFFYLKYATSYAAVSSMALIALAALAAVSPALGHLKYVVVIYNFFVHS